MTNADIAIRAAKDLNADSLAPDLYRKAVDAYFQAKRFYRLKDFKKAKSQAVVAMKIAERAEFIAYQKGGEASTLYPPEGASGDPDSEFKDWVDGPTAAQPPATKESTESGATPTTPGNNAETTDDETPEKSEAANPSAKDPANKPPSAATPDSAPQSRFRYFNLPTEFLTHAKRQNLNLEYLRRLSQNQTEPTIGFPNTLRATTSNPIGDRLNRNQVQDAPALPSNTPKKGALLPQIILEAEKTPLQTEINGETAPGAYDINNEKPLVELGSTPNPVIEGLPELGTSASGSTQNDASDLQSIVKPMPEL